MNICDKAEEIVLDGQEATRALGAALAEALEDGDVVALIGELGAGKTELVRAVAAALGADERDVASPTFVYLNIYTGRRTLYHFDAYRLHAPQELVELGAREFFGAGGISFVEWADRVREALPERHLEITLRHGGKETRRIATLRGRGGWSKSLKFHFRRNSRGSRP
jgi:tRNA threonylcarbamoyladenosine biosynthesis protein TsaE